MTGVTKCGKLMTHVQRITQQLSLFRCFLNGKQIKISDSRRVDGGKGKYARATSRGGHKKLIQITRSGKEGERKRLLSKSRDKQSKTETENVSRFGGKEEVTKRRLIPRELIELDRWEDSQFVRKRDGQYTATVQLT